MAAWAYEVHVLGEVTDDDLTRLRAQFGSVVTVAEPASSVITGTVPDQASFIGLLDHMHALGLEVRELRRVAGPEPPFEDPPYGRGTQT